MSSQAPVDRGVVLVAEDDAAIADLVVLYLRQAGFGARVERNGEDVLPAVRQHKPVALVLDIGLPGKDGIEICQALRTAGDWTPVLFVTARDDEVDRLLGLEIGADDYITKPFSPRELVARVRTVLRRSAGLVPTAEVYAVGGARVDVASRRAWAGQTEISLTSTEFDLLTYLLRHPGRVFERDQLLSSVWGYASPAGSRTVDVHIAQLRAKLGPESPIRTVRGIGYAADSR